MPATSVTSTDYYLTSQNVIGEIRRPDGAVHIIILRKIMCHCKSLAYDNFMTEFMTIWREILGSFINRAPLSIFVHYYASTSEVFITQWQIIVVAVIIIIIVKIINIYLNGEMTATTQENKSYTPEVMTTDWNRSNTGLMAIDASRQLKCIIGLDIVGVRSSNGSIIRTNPANISHS